MRTVRTYYAAVVLMLVCSNGSACVAPAEDQSPVALDSDTAVTLLGAYILFDASLQPTLEAAACADEYPLSNSAYFSAARGWALDTGPARLVVLGDSTMDISTRYAGYLSADSRNRAISGNSICDVHQQLPAVQFFGLSEIFISTADGNGVLQGVSTATSIRAGEALIDRLRERWPLARITVVGIHPTLIAQANANKGAVNAGIKAYVDADGNACYLDPLPIFGVAEGAAASPAQMLDDVHYSFAMSWAIRQAAFDQCAVQL
ncbi:MAG: SGNH/GDSL hydrolase family protein [bacterium]|nr:SGNH/GDSL hydrolase family protein [bacterium]